MLKMMLLKKLFTMNWVAKVNNNSSDFMLKTKYQTGKTKLEKIFLMRVILLKN